MCVSYLIEGRNNGRYLFSLFVSALHDVDSAGKTMSCTISMTHNKSVTCLSISSEIRTYLYN